MFNFKYACLRQPGPSFHQALAQHPHGGIHLPTLYDQHQNYLKALQHAGLKTYMAPYLPEFPDGPFTEDTHLILPEMILRLNPGAASRANEPESLRSFLPADRPYFIVPLTHTVDGGDILLAGKEIYIGRSSRTQDESIAWLKKFLGQHGYQTYPLTVKDGLHLKSALTAIDQHHFIINDHAFFQEDLDFLSGSMNKTIFRVDAKETRAANILSINEHVLIPHHSPQLKNYLEYNFPRKKIVEMDLSEFAKADGAITCLSLRW